MSESTTIRFHESFPHVLKEEVERLLRPLLFIIPEIHDLNLRFETEEGEASIQPIRRYHVAHIALDPIFFSLAFDEKERTLLHELLHIKADIFAREVETIVQMWVPEPMQPYIAQQVSDREEEMVDDIARIIQRLLTCRCVAPKLEEYHYEGDSY